MTELVRTRDVVVLFKGVTQPVDVTPAMVQGGWAGGQGVKWAPNTGDGFLVAYGDGVRGAGFLLWGSDEDSDQYTSLTEKDLKYAIAVLCSGSWLISTRTFEIYTYASRQVGPPVPISYSVNDKLYWSLRGVFTNEDEWTLSGDPRSPNDNQVGWVVQTPTSLTNNYLTLQTTL
jgi:hypothetical protein